MAINVLIVDDSPAMRKVVARILQLSGLQIGSTLEAADGVAALQIMRSSWVDLVLTDINMPGMNGEQFVGQLANDRVLAAVPVVVVSTDHTEARIDRLKALGAKGYICKPFRPESLRDEVHRILGRGACSRIN